MRRIFEAAEVLRGDALARAPELLDDHEMLLDADPLVASRVALAPDRSALEQLRVLSVVRGSAHGVRSFR
jgi:hypothetical protein